MENYAQQSYTPDKLHIACSGSTGYKDEPFSLVPSDDLLTQNILLLAYSKPLTPDEIAKGLGVPAPYIEPVVEKLLHSELMQRTKNGKVYTDFIIYTREDRTSTTEKQLKLVEEHFDRFWQEMEKDLMALQAKDYYARQTPECQNKLALHFLLKVLMNAHIAVRDEVTGAMPFADYPYRRDGGRWLALGHAIANGHSLSDDGLFSKYAGSGESSTVIHQFSNAKTLMLKAYSTTLGYVPGQCHSHEHIKWLYELHQGISPEKSIAKPCVLESADILLEYGILKQEDTLKLSLPVLTAAEYQDECALAAQCEQTMYAAIREKLLPLFEDGYVKLPKHLQSVPKWQQYMLCGDSVPMAAIYQAMEKELLFRDVDYKLPGALLVVEKA